MATSISPILSAQHSNQVDSVLPLCRLVAIKIGLDVGLFDHLSHQGEKSVDVEELASATGVEPRLLHRILRILAITNVVSESGPGNFRANDASHLWTNPDIRAACDFQCVSYTEDSDIRLTGASYDHSFKVMLTLPTYLKETGYREPTDPTKAAWNVSSNSSLPFFKWLDSPGNEKLRSDFDKSMKAGSMTRYWFETTVPVCKVLGDGCDPEAPLFVDIGGGLGEHAYKLHTAHPYLVGKLIVQDLPQSINEAKKRSYPAKIDLMEYDFFTAQPIQGARNYFLRRVLHDWPDEQAIQILQNQRTALRKGYSKLLLNEKVIPDQGAKSADVVSDLIGMVIAATERTEREWRGLVAQVDGLAITDIIAFEGCTEKIIVIQQE